MQFKLILLAGLGGFIGSALRYIIFIWFQSRTYSSFPYATLTVNIIGSFALGVILGLFLAKTGTTENLISNNWKVFLGTGVLGGFTTFSAFSAETFQLIENGHVSIAAIYVSLSVLLGLGAVFVGFMLMK